MDVGLEHYLVVAATVFVLGIVGVLINRKNIIRLFMSIELMLLSVNINLVAFSAYMEDMVGQVFSIFVISVAAAEAAIGLAIIMIYFRKHKSVAVEDISGLRG